MENKINIAELLRNCPRGMELDCVSFNNVTFECVSDEGIWIKYIDSDSKSRLIHLTPHGEIELNHIKTECVIFPKGKTTWEGFVLPHQFKDGDIVISYLGSIHILKNSTTSYCYLDRLGLLDKSETTYVRVMRFATEEEKQKLFDAIKAKGYKWNVETKTLEKLVLNKFDITTLKPFDKVLVKTNNEHVWSIQFFERVNKASKKKHLCVWVVTDTVNAYHMKEMSIY